MTQKRGPSDSRSILLKVNPTDDLTEPSETPKY